MLCSFFFNLTTPTEIYTLSLHDALPIYRSLARNCSRWIACPFASSVAKSTRLSIVRSEEHTSELQSLRHLVCRLLLEKKNADLIDIVEVFNPRSDEKTNRS